MAQPVIIDERLAAPPPPADRNHADELASIELSLLLDAMLRWRGYDFRDYSPAILKRRVAECLRAENVQTISGLQERFLHDEEALRRFVCIMSTNSNRLFRAPEYFRAIRQRVVTFLRTYSFARLWFPACWTGEDVYTVLAILFEEDLLDRCMLYATDLSDLALAQAREGVFDINSYEEFSNDYLLSGGRKSVSDFCEYADGKVKFNEQLSRNLIFATHSLATDASLNEFHAIIARGVLPQFNKTLQYRVHNLFLQSLSRFGFICLSSAESLHSTPHEGAFKKVDDVFPIYRRMR
jgi:chemotaxis protein methyltransferase CheR